MAKPVCFHVMHPIPLIGTHKVPKTLQERVDTLHLIIGLQMEAHREVLHEFEDRKNFHTKMPCEPLITIIDNALRNSPMLKHVCNEEQAASSAVQFICTASNKCHT